jgi:hypothetical protein
MIDRHRRIRIFIAVLGSVLIFIAGWQGRILPQSAANQEAASVKRTAPEEGLHDFMKAKLAAINAAMEAAANDDYPAVERAGLDLIQLSKQAAWNRHANAAYLQDTADFVESAEFMMRMAHAEDSQGVASSFGAVSTCCLNCHRHVRSPKVADRFWQADVMIAFAQGAKRLLQ